MLILSLARFLAALVSLALLAVGGYLLWSWYDGAWARDPAGVLVRVRQDWRLWTGGALLAWSFLGRFLLPFVLARGGDFPTRAAPGTGEVRPGAAGSSLYVETAGRAGAPIIVFTHGWGMDLTFWNQARHDLADRFRLIFWDLPGLGRSKASPGGEIAVANFASDLAGLLAGLDRPAVLVGHSIGGMTLQTLVRDHPQALDKVSGLVLLNTTYTNPLKTMVFSRLLLALQKPLLEPMMHLTIWLQPLVWLSKWQSYLSGSMHAGMRLGFGKFVTRGQLEHAALLAARAPPAIEAKGDLAMFGWDATGAMSACRRPVLIIGGDRDIVTKLEASEAIAAQAAGAELLTIEGVNHMGPMERADLYNAAIAAFALSLEPPLSSDLRASPTGGATPDSRGGAAPSDGPENKAPPRGATKRPH